MADFILHLDVIFSDRGTVDIVRGGWSFKHDVGTGGPVTQDKVAHAISSAVASGSLEPINTDPATTRAQFPSGLGPKPVSGLPDGKALAEKIAAQGWLERELAESLIAHAGVARVRDVSNWIARKINSGEPVQRPGSLLTSLANRPA